ETLIAGPAIVGSPGEVVDRIGTMKEMLDLDRVIFMFDLGGIPDEVLFATMELFGAEVMPAIG
ncbi:MAG: methylene-tetrahydromethanopterin reductase, partial [Pseudomonadota bacterium]|nr:methylene-tetrahydromethanopterin reductase [Pseudomonadota bacterium]